MSKQKGFSLTSLIVGMAIFAVVAILGFKIGFAYMEKYTIQSIINSAFKDVNNESDKDPKKIKNNIMNKLKVHTTDIKDSDITVKQNNSNIDVDVELMRTIGVTDSISIDIDLSFSTDLNSSK